MFLRLVSSFDGSGESSLLWPEWVKSFTDIPADLAHSIEHASKLNSWMKNLSEDEIPPVWMWHIDSEIEVWFEHVDFLRKSKYGMSGDDFDDDGSMEENELAKMFKS